MLDIRHYPDVARCWFPGAPPQGRFNFWAVTGLVAQVVTVTGAHLLSVPSQGYSIFWVVTGLVVQVGTATGVHLPSVPL